MGLAEHRSQCLSRRALADPKLRDVFIDAITTAASAAGGPGGWLEQEIASAYAQILKRPSKIRTSSAPTPRVLSAHVQMMNSNSVLNG